MDVRRIEHGDRARCREPQLAVRRTYERRNGPQLRGMALETVERIEDLKVHGFRPVAHPCSKVGGSHMIDTVRAMQPQVAVGQTDNPRYPTKCFAVPSLQRHKPAITEQGNATFTAGPHEISISVQLKHGAQLQAFGLAEASYPRPLRSITDQADQVVCMPHPHRTLSIHGHRSRQHAGET